MSVLVRCAACGQEVDSRSVDRKFHCPVCRATAAISRDLTMYERYWRKREHYRRGGVSLKAVDGQLVRLVVRMSDRMRGHLPDAEAQRALLNRLLAEAREKVEGETRRILLPG